MALAAIAGGVNVVWGAPAGVAGCAHSIAGAEVTNAAGSSAASATTSQSVVNNTADFAITDGLLREGAKESISCSRFSGCMV